MKRLFCLIREVEYEEPCDKLKADADERADQPDFDALLPPEGFVRED